jgi:thiamine biosynthesis lipoprotein
MVYWAEKTVFSGGCADWQHCGGGQSVVTSGIYERYFEQDGKRWHHILDPRSGYPLDNELESVTIISADSLDGDIWTT